MKKRVEQFVKSLKAKVSQEEYYFVDTYLGDKQLKDLFIQLPVFEQRHCIDVAQTILTNYSEGLDEADKDILTKTALLHDIGKMNMGLNPITKSLAVVLDKVSRNGAKKLLGNVKFINGFYNHPELGAEMLESKGVSKEITYLVRNHHNKDKAVNDKLLRILIQADELN